MASLSGEPFDPPLDPAPIAEGARAFDDGLCPGCHLLGRSEAVGPALGGCGSRDWLVGLLRDPAAPVYYGSERGHGMPSYAHPTEKELRALAAWLVSVRRTGPGIASQQR